MKRENTSSVLSKVGLVLSGAVIVQLLHGGSDHKNDMAGMGVGALIGAALVTKGLAERRYRRSEGKGVNIGLDPASEILAGAGLGAAAGFGTVRAMQALHAPLVDMASFIGRHFRYVNGGILGGFLAGAAIKASEKVTNTKAPDYIKASLVGSGGGLGAAVLEKASMAGVALPVWGSAFWAANLLKDKIYKQLTLRKQQNDSILEAASASSVSVGDDRSLSDSAFASATHSGRSSYNAALPGRGDRADSEPLSPRFVEISDRTAKLTAYREAGERVANILSGITDEERRRYLSR